MATIVPSSTTGVGGGGCHGPPLTWMNYGRILGIVCDMCKHLVILMFIVCVCTLYCIVLYCKLYCIVLCNHCIDFVNLSTHSQWNS